MFNNSSTNNNTTNPSKTSGLWHSAKGEVKEGLGHALASADLKQQGREEHIAGQAQYDAARNKGATVDHVSGKKDAILDSVSGGHGNTRQNQGERVNEERLPGEVQHKAPRTQGSTEGTGDHIPRKESSHNGNHADIPQNQVEGVNEERFPGIVQYQNARAQGGPTEGTGDHIPRKESSHNGYHGDIRQNQVEGVNEERLPGEVQHNASRAQGVTGATSDRVSGKEDSILHSHSGSNGNGIRQNQVEGVNEHYPGEVQHHAAHPQGVIGGTGDHAAGKKDSIPHSHRGSHDNVRQNQVEGVNEKRLPGEDQHGAAYAQGGTDGTGDHISGKVNPSFNSLNGNNGNILPVQDKDTNEERPSAAVEFNAALARGGDECTGGYRVVAKEDEPLFGSPSGKNDNVGQNHGEQVNEERRTGDHTTNKEDSIPGSFNVDHDNTRQNEAF